MKRLMAQTLAKCKRDVKTVAISPPGLDLGLDSTGTMRVSRRTRVYWASASTQTR